MSWLPRIGVFSTATTDPTCGSWDGFEGKELVFSWLGFLVILSFARRSR